MLEIQSCLGPHKPNPLIGHLSTGWLAHENLRFIFHFCFFSLPVPVWRFSTCEGGVSTRLLLLWETMLQSMIFILPIAGLWVLAKKSHGRTWENVCGSLCVGTYVLEGVGHNGESEHSWGLAQVDKVPHLTFQQGITIQWGMMPRWKTTSCGWLWQAAANCRSMCLLTSSLIHLHSHCLLLTPSFWLRRDTS